MVFKTHKEYLSALVLEARKRLAKHEDSWAGPGTYVLGGYMSDEWCPVVTLEIAPSRPQPESGNRPVEAGKGEP